MSAEPSVAGPQRRGEPVVARVLSASIEELALTGYAGLTLERVASRAGVNRTTIYRRWPTKRELVEATLRYATTQLDFRWDHGNLRDDLTELVRCASETLFTPGMLGLHRLMMEAHDEPSLHEIVLQERRGKQEQLLGLLHKAELRGELRPGLDKELLLDGIFGTLFAKVVFQRQPITKALGKRLVDHFMSFAQASGAPPKAPARAAPGSRAAVRRKAPDASKTKPASR